MSGLTDGGRVAILDPHALEEGRLAAHARSHLGALTELAEEDGASEPVTRRMVAARLRVLEDARTKLLDELSLLQGKIVGLREILDQGAEVSPGEAPPGEAASPNR